MRVLVSVKPIYTSGRRTLLVAAVWEEAVSRSNWRPECRSIPVGSSLPLAAGVLGEEAPAAHGVGPGDGSSGM
jgi:hypothetical protein